MQSKSNNMVDGKKQLEPFGNRRPVRLFEWMIRFLHTGRSLVLRKMLAPVIRKIVINSSRLPIDIQAGDLKLRCKFTDNYSEKKYVFSPWRYDIPERTELAKALPEDGTFIDIGANVGLYTLFASQIMGGEGRILAFEPNPPTLKRLLTNIDANRSGAESWPNLEVLEIGIADENTVRTLTVNEDNLGASSIAESNESGPEESIECRLLTDVLQEYSISHIDALKIDIEGAEDIALFPFLETAEDALLPKLIIIENSQDKWSRDLFGILKDKGYSRVLKTRLNSVLKLKDLQSSQNPTTV